MLFLISVLLPITQLLPIIALPRMYAPFLI